MGHLLLHSPFVEHEAKVESLPWIELSLVWDASRRQFGRYLLLDWRLVSQTIKALTFSEGCVDLENVRVWYCASLCVQVVDAAEHPRYAVSELVVCD